MQIKVIRSRVIRWLTSGILGLIGLVLLLMLLIHLPPVQKQITTRVANYLSTTINTGVTIDRIYLSLWDGIVVRGLRVDDPGGGNLLASNRLGIVPNLINLIYGDLRIHYLNIEGIQGQLINTQQGLNIQFIIDAFQSEEETPSQQEKRFSMDLALIELENIDFNYSSTIDELNLSVKLGKLDADQFVMTTNPNAISLSKLLLEGTEVVLITTNQSSSGMVQLPGLDFGSGFNIDLGLVELKNNSVAVHSIEEKQSLKFDPEHLVLNNTSLTLSDLIARKDSLSFQLEDLSIDLEGFQLQESSATLKINPQHLILSDLMVASDESKVKVSIEATYDNWVNLWQEMDQASVDLSVAGVVSPGLLDFFLPPPAGKILEELPLSEIEIKGEFDKGILDLKTISLSAGENQLNADGRLMNLMNEDSIVWSNLQIKSVFGPAFKSIVTSYAGSIVLPADLHFDLLTSGSLNSFDLAGQISSSAGYLNANATVGLNQETVELDLKLDAEDFNLGSLLDLTWLGPATLSLQAHGGFNSDSGLLFESQITSIDLSNQKFNNIDAQGSYKGHDLDVELSLDDPDYTSVISAQFQFDDTLRLSSVIQLEDFNLGQLVGENSLLLSGNFYPTLNFNHPSFEGTLKGLDITIFSEPTNYSMDSLMVDLRQTPEGSQFEWYSDHIEGQLKANFDIQQLPRSLADILRNFQGFPPKNAVVEDPGNFDFHLKIEDITPLKLFNKEFDNFSQFVASGRFDERAQILEIQAETSEFKGYGVTLDSMKANFEINQNQVSSSMLIDNIVYEQIPVGNLAFNIFEKRDSVFSSLVLSNDSISVLDIKSSILWTSDGILIHLDSMVTFDKRSTIDNRNQILIASNHTSFEHFKVNQGAMKLQMEGDINDFTFKILDADLRNLNYIMPYDSSTINNGTLDAMVSYSRDDRELELDMVIDSLAFNNLPVIKITAEANSSGGKKIPMSLVFNSAANDLRLTGDYLPHNQEVDALLELDINDLEMFEFLFQDYLGQIRGKVKGQTRVSGTAKDPVYKGSFRFQNLDFMTLRPRTNFQIKDEIITLDNSGVVLDSFIIYDQLDNPLTLDGVLKTKDYKSFEYDLTVSSDNYLLVDNPANEDYPLLGILVIGSNLKFSGNEKDTQVEANIIIRDTTDLSYVMPRENLELLTNVGIVEFVDPEVVNDSIVVVPSQSLYDSLMSSLPKFNLNSQVTLEDEAVLRIIVDARSGDFIEASGSAKLNFNIDRTGNPKLEGKYTIARGFYQLSFYDLVKKKFDIADGSSVTWTGNSNDGALDFKAIHIINTPAIGLIGHEIGENERDLYRKPLPFEVGIIIKGTIENPIVSFDLDLPQDVKADYPTLGNKLDRLKQPEFETELNQQVFGLLVLGGFIPEESGSEFDASVTATTTLKNSVNSILAGQMNRFAGKLVKGVDINVGMQSYSDFTSAGGGQTRTALDVRVSKRMMDDRLSIEVGGGMDLNSELSGATNTGADNFRGDFTVVYDLTESGAKKLKFFNNETYDIIYHEVRNTGISLIFIKNFDKGEKSAK